MEMDANIKHDIYLACQKINYGTSKLTTTTKAYSYLPKFKIKTRHLGSPFLSRTQRRSDYTAEATNTKCEHAMT